MILEGGTIHTGDPALPRVRALPIDDRGRVARGVEAWEGEGSAVSNERINLEGRTIVPGFVDAHVHFLSWALAADQIDLRAAPSGAAALDLLRARSADDRSKGRDENWLLGAGWSEAMLADIADPAALLDAASGGRPAAIWARDHHALWLSTSALKAVGLAGDGIVRERAAWSVPLPKPTRTERHRAVVAAQKTAHTLGVTGVHDFEQRLGRRTWQELDIDGRVTLRVVTAVQAEHLAAVDAVELVSGYGSTHLKTGPIKAFCDGTLGARTAHMLAPYADSGSGEALLDHAGLVDLIIHASEQGLSVALHAIGDAAVRTALDALQQTQPTWSRLANDHPPRIEHAQLIDPTDLNRFAALGVVASMQPVHAIEDQAIAQMAWGDRCAGAYAWGPLHSTGATLVLGSDAPISPLNPLAAIAAAVGRPLWPGHALTADAALRAITVTPSLVTGQARTVGRLAPGLAADLVVLDADPTEVDPAAITTINIVATMIGGRWVHGRPPW